MTGPAREAPDARRARALVEVAPGVHVATSTIWTTTSTVVVTRSGEALVVDPGVTVGECAALADTIAARGWRVTAGFSTHPHWDHVLWHEGLGRVPRWAAARAVAELGSRRGQVLAAVDADAPGHDSRLVGALDALPDGATVLPWPDEPAALPTAAGAAVAVGPPRVVGHDAHAPGHAALVVAGVLLAGDMLSDTEVPLVDTSAPDPVGTYRVALDVLEEAGRDVRVLVPGHGSPAAGPSAVARRFAADRAYLDALERAASGGPAVEDPRLSGYVVDWHTDQLAALRS
ncbi:MBL fold metallo-hydrolase [Cellulosimicrobium sp. PMB13]|uniref:MBL fold metallo-hydrolase n=1 Tax=Cellulosimicrobium sp. PMB13 TaxID=3120158 RepID=UPI003F4C17AC